MCPKRLCERSNLHDPVLEKLHRDGAYEHSHLFGPGHPFAATVIVSDVNAGQMKRSSKRSKKKNHNF